LGRVLSQIGLGMLGVWVSPGLVDDALGVTDRDERRFRVLPSRLGVYFLLALCLLRTKSYSAVIRTMTSADIAARWRGLGRALPSTTALSKMRDRIGVAPFTVLFHALARRCPTRRRGWSHAFGLLVCAWDGTEIALADTPANRAGFVRHRGHRGKGQVGVPKARLLVLLCCGSRRLIDAVVGNLGQGETTLAHRLLAALRPGMLLLADRAFLGYPLWKAARARGAHLLWRARNNKPLLPARRRLADGSYLSTIYDPVDAQRWRKAVARNRKRGHRPPKPRRIAGITVRVVEALITITIDGKTRTQHYRLVTSLLDPHTAPADELITLYARRWAAETGIREIKTVLLAGRALRGTTPTRALQEVWASLIVYQAIRLLIAHAAHTRDLDPSQISFTAARDAAQTAITTTPAQAREHLTQACHDLCNQLIPRHTHHRSFPRALKDTYSRYPYRGPTRRSTSNNTTYHITTTTPPYPPPTRTPPPTPAEPRAA
jgi:transposase IS4-like protein/DDE family transposase